MLPIPQTHIFYCYDIAHTFLLFLKYFSTSIADKFIIKVSIIKIAAIANAIPNSPCSFAYTYNATVSVQPELESPSIIPFSAWANPAVNKSAADSPKILPTDKIQPVIIPSTQPGRTTVWITRHLPAPRPKAPSR